MAFTIRLATIQDARGMAAIHITTQRHAYRDVIPALAQQPINLDAAEISKREKLEQDALNQSCSFVAQDEQDSIIGYATGGPNRDQALRFDSELYNLFVLPDYQQRGIGTALFARIVEFLISQNHQSLMLWTLPIPSTITYYQNLGGAWKKSRPIEILTIKVDLDCYGWNTLTSLQKQLLRKHPAP